MDSGSRCSRSRLLPPRRPETIFEIVIVCLCITSVASQYGDFYTNLEALFSGSNVNPTPTTTKTPLPTPRPFVSLGQLLALDQPAETLKPKQTPDAPSPNPRVGLTRGTPARTGNTRAAAPAPNDLFTMMNLNSWQDIPQNLFAPSHSRSVAPNAVPPTSQSGTKSGSSWQGISFSDTGPGQSLGWDYSANGLDHGSNTGLESGNMVGGAAGGAQEPFLPLADHSPGSTMADQPGQMADWSAPPVSKDTYKYDDEPTPKPKPPADGESMAKAILRGQVRRWQWNYSTTLLQGEISGRGYGGHYDNSVQCCHRLPYICGVDGMCVIDKNECNEFCICASNPTMPHCIRDVIPRIKKTMAVLEKKILERVSIELNLPVPVAIAHASLPLLEITVTTTSTTSTRRPTPFILTRQSTTTTTTNKKPNQRLLVTPLQTTKKSPTLIPQTRTGASPSKSGDLTTTKIQAHNSPVAPSTSSTTERTTHQAAEEKRKYNRFIYQPLASTTTTNPKTTPWLGFKTKQITTKTSPATTTTRRPTQRTVTAPLFNPFQVTLPTTPHSTESTPGVNMELRLLGTKSSLYKTTATPPPEDSVGLLSAPTTTSFLDPMMLQPDGTVGGNTHHVASSRDNNQDAGMTFADSAFGMLDAPIGSSDVSDPHNRASLSQDVDSNVFSTTSLSETTIKETSTQTSGAGSPLTVVVNSALGTDAAGTSASPFEKPVLVSTEQRLVSLSETGSIRENASLKISTASTSRVDSTLETDAASTSASPFEKPVLVSTEQRLVSLSETGSKSENASLKISTASTSRVDSRETPGFIAESTTANVTSDEGLTTTSELSVSSSDKITNPLTESDQAVSDKFKVLSRSTSAMMTTAANIPMSGSAFISSSTAATAPNSTLTFPPSSTAANALNSTLTIPSSSTAATAPNSILTNISSSTAASSSNYTLKDLSFSTASHLQQQETYESVQPRDFTVRNTSVDPPATSRISPDTTTQSDNQPNENTGQPNTTSRGSITTAVLHNTTGSPPFDTRNMQVSLTVDGNPAPTPQQTGDNTTTPIAFFGSDSSLNTSLIVDGVPAQTPKETGDNNTIPIAFFGSDFSLNTSLTVDGVPAQTPKETGDNTTIPIAFFGSDSSLNASPQNRSDLVNGAQEEDFFAWFNNDDSKKYPLQNAAPSMSSAPRISPTDSGDKAAPCGYDCDKKGGRCLLGEDFKPHCVVMDGDPCDHFRCINGMCALTDGLHVCKCGEGWTGTFCEQPCSVDCGEHGTCGRVGSNMTGCICEFNYTGDRCGEKKLIKPTVTEISVPMDGLKVWEVAVVAVVTAVCLGLMFVLLPYTLWRRQWLPMRQLVFYFQEYEDDDDKEYDAFISYKSTPRDERFILHHLYPRLEKELDFRLCLHFRDFPPGEPIANNIIHAIENSRRTIMVLSPSYVASEWCRMEYQKAQHEMLRMKHKIIPIVLEDVSSMPEMDANLRTIIDTVTYIEWPGEEEPGTSKRIAKFWKLLELSMPKKKGLSRSLSSMGSCSSELPLTSVSKTCFNSIVTSLLSDDVFTSSSLKSCTSSLSKLSIGGSTCGGNGDRKGSGGGGSSADVRTNSDVSTTTKNVDGGSELSPVSEVSTVSLRSKELFSENFVRSPLTQVVCRNVGAGLPRPRTDTDLCKKEVESTMTRGPGTGERKGSAPEHAGTSPAQVGQSPAQVEQSPALVGQSPASAPVKNSPVVVRSKPHVSSDDFIVEIRETGAQGKQIKVTSRPPRKYASQLLV